MEYANEVLSLKKSIKERSLPEAIRLAGELIKILNIKTYPIPIVKILNELGFSTFASSIAEPNISGMIFISPDLIGEFKTDKVIIVDRNDLFGRQRFTLAHEFAHYLFDFDEQSSHNFVNKYDISKASTDNEAVPSRFAAEFLMPSDMFAKRYKELSSLTQYSRILQLVIDFDVTQTAVLRRIDELSSVLGGTE